MIAALPSVDGHGYPLLSDLAMWAALAFGCLAGLMGYLGTAGYLHPRRAEADAWWLIGAACICIAVSLAIAP